MAKQCQISKVNWQNGNRVSHANNKTHHMFMANLQTKKIFVPELNRSVRLKLSTRVIRTISKIGLDATLRKFNVKMKDLI